MGARVFGSLRTFPGISLTQVKAPDWARLAQGGFRVQISWEGVNPFPARHDQATVASQPSYSFWTFGGSVPGKFIRIRHGDEVEFHLINRPDSKMPHNIDLHAVTGPGGGAASSFTAPGHESIFSFKAINPGLYKPTPNQPNTHGTLYHIAEIHREGS